MTHRDWLAVGVDGSEGSKAAIRWAAREADRLGSGLVLVHAYPSHRAVGSLHVAAYPPPEEEPLLAPRLLDEAKREAEQILPPDRVETSALRADPRAALLQAAAQSRMLALGDESRPALSRIVTGSIVAPVAAHSPVPVAVVPANWQDATARGVVVAAVKNYESAAALVRSGFELAGRLGAGLTLVHVWDYLASYDDAIATHASEPEWERRARAALVALVDRFAPDFPGVRTDVRVVHGQPARVLADLSSDAAVLMITRRPHGFPFGHLGGTGRAVLRETRCPTVVLPAAVESMDASGGEAAGRLQANGTAAPSQG